MHVIVKTLLGVSALILIMIGAGNAHAQVSGDGGCCNTPFKRLNRTQAASVQIQSGALYDDLLTKSYKELILLKIDENVCDSMNCRGMIPGVVKKYIEAALGERQIEDNAKISMMNALASDFSSRISVVAAVISIISLIVTLVFGILNHRREKLLDAILLVRSGVDS